MGFRCSLPWRVRDSVLQLFLSQDNACLFRFSLSGDLGQAFSAKRNGGGLVVGVSPRERKHYRQTHSIPFGHPALSEKWQLFDTPEFSETASVFEPNGTPNPPGDEVTKSAIFVILHLGEYGVSLLSPLASPRFRFAVLPLAGQRLPFSFFPLWRVWGSVAPFPCEFEVPFCIPPLA